MGSRPYPEVTGSTLGNRYFFAGFWTVKPRTTDTMGAFVCLFPSDVGFRGGVVYGQC